MPFPFLRAIAAVSLLVTPAAAQEIEAGSSLRLNSPVATVVAGTPRDAAGRQPGPVFREETVELGPMEVRADREDDPFFDGTGMGTYEQQLRDMPFANELTSAEALEDDPVAMELVGELRQIAHPSAVDLATGDSRVSLRGFPTPLLRNGFVTMGMPDMLNTSRTIVIQGALVPVLGRAAPGGIQDFLTARPRTRPGQSYSLSLSSLQRQNAAAEMVGIAQPRKAWHRVAAQWDRRTGPEEYSASETRAASGALTWKHGPAASTLFAVDFQQIHATAAPGIPEYRPASGRKIVGPYMPLAGFNALGPEAGVRRRTASATLLLDAQPHPKVALRAGVEAWWRTLEQDRFTTSIYNMATGRFDGVREPRHLEQPQRAALGHLEITGRFRAFHAEHKLMAALNHTEAAYVREERALSTELRNALPASVRLFRPEAPDYYRPPFYRDIYSRVLTDREERARYTALELGDRMAFADGQWVFTSGLRQDFVALDISDRREGAAQPSVKTATGQVTYHFGANYQASPGRLLLFATTSTAFEPSTRIDARTGRVQENEMTRGYETGLKGRFFKQALDVTAAGFLLYNEAISRRNPLYDDPIFDANQTQPQLVASGEERFSGGKLEARFKRTTLTLAGRIAYARAITTASPDIPEEVGRQMTRVPLYTASASAYYGIPKGRLRGLSLGASWNYIAGFTATYGDSQREFLEYPGYGLLGLNASRAIKRGKHTHTFGLSVRNALDRDLLAGQARLGAGREWMGSWRLAL